MSGRFAASPTLLTGVLSLRRKRLGDARGYFERMFCAEELAQAGWTKPISQINHTLTKDLGTLRGLHYQSPPHAEAKMVTCLAGRVLDVALDLRAGSPTFLQWHAQVLSGDEADTLFIPEGVAHGFQTLTDNVEMLYFHSAPHAPKAEAGVHPLDPRLGIDWPLPVSRLSDRDAAFPFLQPDFQGLTL